MIKIDKVTFTRFFVNKAIIYSYEPKKLLEEVFLSVPDIYLWSSESIKEFVIGTFEIINQFGEQVKKELKESRSAASGDVARAFSKFSTWTDKTLKFIPKDRDKLIYFIYNIIMMCEGNGHLSGFGMSNKHNDKIPGNPERTTICPLPVWNF